MDFGDLVSMDYEMPQQDQFDWANATYSMPQSGWSFGQDLGTSDFEMPDFSSYFEMPDISQSFTNAPDLGQFELDKMGGPSQAQNFTSMSDAIRSQDSPFYSSTPGVSDMQSPAASIASVGQNMSGGPSGGVPQEDDWKKQLLKGGMGIGTSLLGTGVSAALKSAMEPKQQGPQQPAPQAAAPTNLPVAQPLPQAPTPPVYQTAPFIPQPGTKASPLISGGPKQIQMTQGLVNDRIKRGGSAGGFSLY